MNLGHTYIYKILYIYIYMHHAETERNHDGHLTFYLLLSGFRNNQNSCFNFLTSCPMYLFVPPPPPTDTQTDFRPFGTVDSEQSERKRDSKRIHLNELMIIKTNEKLHINWILYFCCCSKQPVHVL